MAAEPEAEIAPEIVAQVQGLEREIQRAVIGQRVVIREVVIGLLAAGHVLVEGVPGLGKTLLVRALAAAVGGRFSRVQFTPDLMPSDISGHVMFDMKRDAFRVRKGPVFCNFLLADEINRAPAKTQSALLEVMQEQQVTIEGTSYALERPFLVLATQNPIEQEGTYPLPQAQLDRFLLKVFIDYPTQDDEQALVQHVTQGAVGDLLDISAVNQLLEPQQIVQLQQYAANLRVDDQIIAYAVRIVRTARDWSGVEVGPGPRGSIALLRAARANALLSGNHFVTPDDVKAVAPAVLRHRMKLTTDLEIEGYRADDVLADILVNVEAPRI
ncbi:MAG: AAA family ATPase [Sedimenticola selenatireducens]|uniref:AAA family ATPase n=2 Tax=Sedimenticola selenatireducens TaxID=191960 RepID=A0A557S0V3_9GAMM|nr:AAA family ATPase [Sedimenticola selenatireducens]TVO70996.1 AAA family ATPase [Sedimenticola selenatireducens]TVT65862.1 MAG: AAA family ATPase [Sedimenticola selenatireducens]